MSTPVQAASLVRPWWRGIRGWLGVAAVVVIGAVLVGTLADEPGRPLDPASTHSDGSKALVRVLGHYGIQVEATSSWSGITRVADRALVVTSPDDYSTRQLEQMQDTVPWLVLVQPGTRVLTTIAPSVQVDAQGDASSDAGCDFPGAAAAGRVAFPSDTMAYVGGQACYGGAVALTHDDRAVLGSAAMLTNEHVDDRGVAALDVNVLTDDRRFGTLVWLTPGADANGPGPASVWDLFPRAAHRAFWWLLLVGALLAIWRARRLGGVVTEPLPVVVRSAELVEGHGRLYARAGARARAAAALRAATTRRLVARLGLPRAAGAEQVAVAAAPRVGRPAAELHALLIGPSPADDADLQRLARDLDQLEARVQEGDATR